ncbi:MAG: site-specific integrase [Chloroflexota bacterium]|nr:site-specific integrase [Chloroflexota bacterium]
MAKRSNGEGSIYQRKDGRWCASLSIGRGKRKHFLGKSRPEVSRKLIAALKARDDGLPTVTERQSVAQFLKSWLEAVRPSIRERTCARYEQYVRLHAVPDLGKIPLTRLTPQHLQRLYSDRLNAGLSATTVHHLHAMLHSALDQAVRWTLVPRNVADLVDPPRMCRHDISTLGPEQAHVLLDAAAGDRLEALYVLALTTGMREGEILGLKWRDVDFAGRAVEVRGSLQRVPSGLVLAEPKTDRSRRHIGLTETALVALRQHRALQATERLRLGAAWRNELDFVFVDETGSPIEATRFLRTSFKPLLKAAGLPKIRFHDLRHSAATLLLGRGIHPKIVSEMLGHSQIAITLDLYSHVTPTMQREATDAMDAIVRR